MTRRAVITGIGVIAPGGTGTKAFWEMLTAGRTATRRTIPGSGEASDPAAAAAAARSGKRGRSRSSACPSGPSR